MATNAHPLLPLLSEINRAANSGFPFLAVGMTVALPDICMSLLSGDGRSDGKRYTNWCTENLGSEFSQITAEDLYSMRCGVLHNGRFGGMKHSCARVIFRPKDPNGNIFADGRLGDAYFYSVEVFCQNFTNAVSAWLEKNKNDPNLIANTDRLMQYRDGFHPYVSGMQVLA